MTEPKSGSRHDTNSLNDPRDWFLPAITNDGSLGKCLSAVIDKLGLQQQFIASVLNRLGGRTKDEVDQLTILAKEVKELENTLRFRLGLLRVDQQAAWFRKAGRKDFGPFRSAMLMEPVFSPYRIDDIEALRASLKKCWQQASVAPLVFSDDSPCLWRILLQKKQAMDQMASLEGVFSHLRLDTLPDDLPAELESRALRAFLMNVRTEFVGVRERLNICFDQLWQTSEKFWVNQIDDAKKRAKAPPKKEYGARQETRQQKRQTTEDAREAEAKKSAGAEHFTERELQASFARMEALRFMGFRHLPSKESLRKRYLEMAKDMHPDRGGSEDSFKRLARAYQELTK